MHSKQQAPARDPMREREEQAQPTPRAARARPSAVAEGPRIGDTASRTRTVTARDIELFSELTGDRNPLHYDRQLARRSRFGGVVMQGGVTSGLLNAVVAEDLPGPGSVFLHVNWAFRGPVRPGDVITADVAVTSIRDDKPVTTLSTTITNQDGVVVLDGTAVVWRDPAVAKG
jgi:acyl dehydratase